MTYWLNEDSRLFLSRDYLQPGQTPESRIREVAETAERILGIKGFADKFESYMLKGWISMSSPVWSNFGSANPKALPISCNGSFAEDDTDSILDKVAEIGKMSKVGSGTSVYLGALRGKGQPIKYGGYSDGPVRFAELFDKVTDVISQGAVRRGACAAYLDADHPDIMDFLEIRSNNHPVQNLHFGVTITDDFMERAIAGDDHAVEVILKIIQRRTEKGEPYVIFIDTVNRLAPDVYRDKGMKIHASNLCSEIALHSSATESFVCCLSSLNLLHYDEWKDTDLVETMVYFLDSTLTEYIDKTAKLPHMEAAHNFAKRQRAIGLGTLGWHSYLQSKMIAFEDFEAKQLNVEIHKRIQEQAMAASVKMAKEYGEPELLKGYGRRHTTLMAIAPTLSSSFILGQVSPSIEPWESNYYVPALAKGKFTIINRELKKLLHTYGKDDEETWSSIRKRGGSVQHLDFLTDHEKRVFKGFAEIPQEEIIAQAAQRQKFIDQSQSLNLSIHPDADISDIFDLMVNAWRLGVKSLYYQNGVNPSLELSQNLSCVSCEA